MKVKFSVEPMGEGNNTLCLHLSEEVMVVIGDSIDCLRSYIYQLQDILGEVEENYSEDLDG